MDIRITIEDTRTGEKHIITVPREIDEDDGWDSFNEIVMSIIKEWSVGHGAASDKLAKRQFDVMHSAWLSTGEAQEYQ